MNHTGIFTVCETGLKLKRVSKSSKRVKLLYKFNVDKDCNEGHLSLKFSDKIIMTIT